MAFGTSAFLGHLHNHHLMYFKRFCILWRVNINPMYQVKFPLLCCCLIIFTLGHTQSSFPAVIDVLMNKTWTAEGEWNNGDRFKQSMTFSRKLNGAFVMTETQGYLDQKTALFGPRSHGIRLFDKKTGTYRFWEFDVSGGVTSGELTFVDKDMYYTYRYGDAMVTDHWDYVDDNTFNYTIGIKEDGGWKEVYLETQIHSQSFKVQAAKMPDMARMLTGSWTSPAWSGIMNESWSVGADGQMVQKGQYMEGNKVLYEATSKIEVVGDEIILFSVINDSNPKIFKATSYNEDSITFENSDYANPRWVTYRFGNSENWSRTIKGVEKNKPVSYTFEFKRVQEKE